VAGSVCGYVVRADTEMPLKDASITVAGGAVAPDIAPLTDSAGWFALDELPAGEWVLRVLGPNDETGEATIPIFDHAFTTVTILAGTSPPDARPVTPNRTGSIEGHIIRSQTREPVENATITVVRGPGPVPDIAPLTDSTGWFALSGLLPGKWVLLARGPDDETGETTVQVLSGGFSNVTIAIASSPHAYGVSNLPNYPVNQTRLGSVDGHVVHAGTGLPVENATVTVVQGTGPAPDIAPLTDSGGWFALDGLPSGDWVLAARGPNGETGEATVRVTAGDLAQITIAISHGAKSAPRVSLSPAIKKPHDRVKGRGKPRSS